jgi:mannose-1-phosphate guanylyltransferase
MFAEKSWGSFQVLDIGTGSMTMKITLNSGNQMHYHSHEHRDEVWVVIAGEGTAVLDGQWQIIRSGDVITMKAGCRHTVYARVELQLIEVQVGQSISVEDKQKYDIPEEVRTELEDGNS